MKRFLKIMPAMAMSLVMILGMTSVSLAESYDYDGTCSFNGSKMVEDFDSGKVADMVSDLQPGDDVVFTVEYKNTCDESTDWYMENSIVKTLERTDQARKKVSGTGQAENGGYTYELIQYDRTGAKNVLFSNSKVGGDEGTITAENGEELEGLEPSTNALEDWFYIDTLKKGESGSVELHVAFDGETEVNDYMDTDGELNVRFAVELTPEGTTPGRPGKTVKTGDQSGLLMWAAIGVVAGLLLLVLAFFSRKRDERSEDGKGGRA